MKNLIIGSTCRSVGKTSVIIGLAATYKGAFGYMKPFGDRLLYKKKKLWDYDAALMTNLFGLHEIPEEISIGFDHSKLRFMYDETSLLEKLRDEVAGVGKDKDIVFIEGGKSLNYGTSVYLDPISIASHTGGKLLLVLGGNENSILDDITFLAKRVDMKDVNFGGIIINKIPDIEEFKENNLDLIERTGLKILGIMPLEKELATFTVGYLAERLFAKILTGEEHLRRKVNCVFIGTMHVNAALENPLFKEGGKAVITSGDRTDMILASLESDTACVVLTEGITPGAKIIDIAKERGIPLLMVPADTLNVAKHIDVLDPLITRDDQDKVALLGRMAREHLRLEEIFKD